MAPPAFAAVAAALQRLSVFLVTNHAAHSKTYDCAQYHKRNHCSHSNPPFAVLSYFASIFPPLNRSAWLSLYGLTSR